MTYVYRSMKGSERTPPTVGTTWGVENEEGKEKRFTFYLTHFCILFSSRSICYYVIFYSNEKNVNKADETQSQDLNPGCLWPQAHLVMEKTAHTPAKKSPQLLSEDGWEQHLRSLVVGVTTEPWGRWKRRRGPSRQGEGEGKEQQSP